MQSKLEGLIQSTENEQILSICLAVNDDMHKTFERFKSLRSGERAQKFVPAESQNKSLLYLQPTYVYG
jgi:hypothetical protein